ncbi:hypothetical protein H2248_003323 [Termitomyces sp. 'cryptogamus']|nr:hypothetical protein H2248_003323 [Termitomyces sp. 'cryptogamus']
MPSCATSPAQASSPPPVAKNSPSTASLPLSLKKAAQRWASKHLAQSPAPQLLVEVADSFLHSLANPSGPTAPVTSAAVAIAAPTSECLMISCSALSHLLQRYSTDITQLAPSIAQQLLVPPINITLGAESGVL